MTIPNGHTFAVEPDKKGPGWHVRVTPAIYQTETVISGFRSEAEAQLWVDEEAEDWVERLVASRKE